MCPETARKQINSNNASVAEREDEKGRCPEHVRTTTTVVGTGRYTFSFSRCKGKQGKARKMQTNNTSSPAYTLRREKKRGSRSS